jgi:hypothetical protein
MNLDTQEQKPVNSKKNSKKMKLVFDQSIELSGEEMSRLIKTRKEIIKDYADVYEEVVK